MMWWCISSSLPNNPPGCLSLSFLQPFEKENHASSDKTDRCPSLAGAFATSAIAAPVTYAVDSGHSFPNFSYQHMGLSVQLSKFDKTTGTVTLDKAAKTASVDVVIDTTSVNTGSTVFNGHIQGEDFFDTAKYPTATFKSTKVVFEGDQPTTIEGDLTIKGITKPVTLKVTALRHQAAPHDEKRSCGCQCHNRDQAL